MLLILDFLVGEDNLCLTFKKAYELHKHGCGLSLEYLNCFCTLCK